MLKPEPLSSLLDSIVSEKRIQYRSHMNIEIDAQLGEAAYGLFANINANEFKRVISNLINNSVEAFKNKIGTIQITLTQSDSNANPAAIIRVAENGAGIPPEILAKLGTEGFSHGKENHIESGSGLGVHHARKSIEQFGGSLHYESQLGKGTTAVIKLPLVQPPAWFAPAIQITDVLVAVDDDASIHQIWDGRAQSIGLQKNEIIHFSIPDQIIEWANSHPKDAKTCTLVIDYEFLGHKLTGLDVLEQLTDF